MAKIKSYSDLQQSKKLAEILPIESADMYYTHGAVTPNIMVGSKQDYRCYIMCWSLAALLDVLPEIDDTSLTFEKVKAEDGYEGYYYHIEYKDIILVPYSKNPIDACVELIIKLHERNII